MTVKLHRAMVEGFRENAMNDTDHEFAYQVWTVGSAISELVGLSRSRPDLARNNAADIRRAADELSELVAKLDTVNAHAA